MESTHEDEDEDERPSTPPPPAPTLLELFQRADAGAAAKLLCEMDLAQARAELPQVFALAPSTAPACFLRCLELWTRSSSAATDAYADSNTDRMRTAHRLLEAALLCMRGMPQPLASDADAELAVALLPVLLRGSSPQQLADFATAYRVPSAALAAVCHSVLSTRAADGVQLLQALQQRTNQPPLLPLQTVLRAAVEQNDLHAADVYVRRNKAHQHAFIELLLAVGAPDKLVKKRIDAFQLDARAFPSFFERRQRATLRYLVHLEQFAEALAFVRDAHPELQMYACTVLVQQRGPTHAMTQYFVRATGLTHAFPSVVVTLPLDFALPRQYEYEPLDAYLSLADCIGAENVVFVDTPEALGTCLTHLEAQSVVGFDCEWSAVHVSSQVACPCATLQLASAHKAFVLDVLALGEVSTPLSLLFQDDAVLKLGFATQGDLKLLRTILGQSDGGPHDVVVSNLLDLQTVARKLYLAGALGGSGGGGEATSRTGQEDDTNTTTRRQTTGKRRGGRRAKSEKKSTLGADVVDSSKPAQDEDDKKNAVGSLSLTDISELYLGKPLDKRARLSDWEQRPLTRAQLHYAALDAHVLVRILAQMEQQHAPEVLGPILRRCTQMNLR